MSGLKTNFSLSPSHSAHNKKVIKSQILRGRRSTITKSAKLVNQLVGALSPIHQKGLYKGYNNRTNFNLSPSHSAHNKKVIKSQILRGRRSTITRSTKLDYQLVGALSPVHHKGLYQGYDKKTNFNLSPSHSAHKSSNHKFPGEGEALSQEVLS